MSKREREREREKEREREREREKERKRERESKKRERGILVPLLLQLSRSFELISMVVHLPFRDQSSHYLTILFSVFPLPFSMRDVTRPLTIVCRYVPPMPMEFTPGWVRANLPYDHPIFRQRDSVIWLKLQLRPQDI